MGRDAFIISNIYIAASFENQKPAILAMAGLWLVIGIIEFILKVKNGR